MSEYGIGVCVCILFVHVCGGVYVEKRCEDHQHAYHWICLHINLCSHRSDVAADAGLKADISIYHYHLSPESKYICSLQLLFTLSLCSSHLTYCLTTTHYFTTTILHHWTSGCTIQTNLPWQPPEGGLQYVHSSFTSM